MTRPPAHHIEQLARRFQEIRRWKGTPREVDTEIEACQRDLEQLRRSLEETRRELNERLKP